MSDTVRRGMIEIEPGSGRFCRYWMRHDPSWYRRELNNSFREKEKQHFQKFGEILRPIKNRVYY